MITLHRWLFYFFVPTHEILSGTSASFADDRGLKDEVSWQHAEVNHDHKIVLHGELSIHLHTIAHHHRHLDCEQRPGASEVV